MNSSTTAPAGAATSAAELVRDLATGRTRYEEVLGWPVSMQVEQHRLVVAVGAVLDAVSMPAALGTNVLHELQIMMLAGPVIAGPGGQSWTFLTQPATGAGPRTDLHRLKVHLTPAGAHTVIPTHLDSIDTSTWSWVQRPRSEHPLPPWSVVIGATRRAAARQPAAPARHARHRGPAS